MANQYKNQTKMTRGEFTQFCESKERDWLITQLYSCKQKLARCEERYNELLSAKRSQNNDIARAAVISRHEENFTYILNKLGYKPKKLLIYYKDKGIRKYLCDSYVKCDHYCDTCDNRYEQDCIGTFVLYDFHFFNGTTYADYDDFVHSELTAIDANFRDIELFDITKIIDLETNKVLFERNEEIDND